MSSKDGTPPPKDKAKGERIAKALARAGVASRREAERMIEAGRVSVNGTLLTTPAFLVTPRDNILVDNAPIEKKQPPRLWRYHKTDGLLTTHNDPGGRPTVFENLPKDLPRVISVGRLDMTSEGLLLLTNDGELARILELPSTGWARRYRARVYGRPTKEQLDSLMKGVIIDGVRTGPIEAKLDKQQGGNAWISITIREGKNREVRRAFETLDMRVNRLLRLSYGPFQLGDLLKGGVEEVPNRILRDQLGHLMDIPETRHAGTLKIFGKGGKKIAGRGRFKNEEPSAPTGRGRNKNNSKGKGKPKGFRPTTSKPAPARKGIKPGKRR